MQDVLVFVTPIACHRCLLNAHLKPGFSCVSNSNTSLKTNIHKCQRNHKVHNFGKFLLSHRRSALKKHSIFNCAVILFPSAVYLRDNKNRTCNPPVSIHTHCIRERPWAFFCTCSKGSGRLWCPHVFPHISAQLKDFLTERKWTLS